MVPSWRVTRTVLALGLSAAAAAPAAGQADDMRFRRYGSDDGLPAPSLRTLAQDRDGFLWMTSAQGLFRFDGENFVDFGAGAGEPGRLATSSVRAVLEDEAGRFWVGTDEGLHRFDRRTRRFERVAQSPDGGDPSWISVNHLLEAPTGDVWIATYEDGLCVLRAGATDVACRGADPALDDPAVPDHVVALAHGAGGTLWLATAEEGLVLLDPSTGSARSFRHDPTDPASLPGDQLNTVHVDRAGQVWVGFYSTGLAELDPSGAVVRHFMPDTTDASSLPVNAVRSVVEASDGRLWVSTWAGGVAVLDRATGRFTVARRDPDDRGSLSDDRALDLIEDDLGQIWVATNDGLNVHDPAAAAFGLLRRDPGNPGSLADDKIRSVLEDREGVVWIGTFGEGLSRWEPGTGRIRNFTHVPGDATSLANEGIWDLHEDAAGRLWVATSRGLHRWDAGLDGFVRYQKRQDTPEPFSDNNILAVASDGSGALWLGTWNTGLNRFDPESGAVEHIAPEPGGLPDGGINDLLVDGRGRLWIAAGSGLARMDTETRAFTRFVVDPTDPTSLPTTAVESLHADASGRVWVGTDEGLTHWDEAAEAFVRHPAASGPFAVHSMADGGPGELWVGSTDGLGRYDVAAGRYTWFDQADGLQGEAFTAGAAHAGPSGRLYFGGTGGLTWFRPEAVTLNRVPPSVRITEFLLLNRPVPIGGDSPLSSDIAYADEVVLDHTDYSFSFEFAALNLRQPEKNGYRYMLEGIDPEWVPADPRYPRITYTGVRPGSYVFSVQGSNDDGVWNEQAASVRVRILPPWWQTGWFRAMVAAGLLVLTAALFHGRTAALERRNADLARQVDARTAELRESNRRLEEASLTDPLTGLHNRRFLAQHLEGDLNRSLRATRVGSEGDWDLVFILLDLDHFKAINDRHGHDGGDLVLRGIADTLREVGRASDFLVRMGGEEFLVVGRFMDRARAYETAERIRTAIASRPVPIGGEATVRVTASLGVACYPFHPTSPGALTWEQVVALADHALYVAKRGGRDAAVAVAASAHARPEELRAATPEDFAALLRDGRLILETSVSETTAPAGGRG